MFLKLKFQDMPEIEFVTQIQNGLYVVKIYNGSKLISFFQIGKMNADVYTLWFYPYEPLEKNISYNAVIKRDTLSDLNQVFTLIYFQAIDMAERETPQMSFQNLIQQICHHIMEFTGI